jgi:putative acetyltransferase
MIRPEQPGDEGPIARIHAEAFAPSPAEAALVQAVREAPGFDPALSLIAFDADGAAGHVLFAPVEFRMRLGRRAALALAPLGVRPRYQRRGWGSRLVQEGLLRAQQRGYDLVFVVGAGEFYSRFGFEPAPGVTNSLGIPNEHFFALALDDSDVAALSGICVYPAAFDAVR